MTSANPSTRIASGRSSTPPEASRRDVDPRPAAIPDRHHPQRELVLASLALHPYPREDRHALRP
jgi:hypothetical protein